MVKDNVREKLVNKLVKLGVFVTRDHAYCVADWIIKDCKKINELNFRQGYYCATANLKRMHDIGVEKELLREYGKINLNGIDEYDVKTLKDILILKNNFIHEGCFCPC